MARDPGCRFNQQQEMLFSSTNAALPAYDLFPIAGYYGNSAARRATRSLIFSTTVSQGAMDTTASSPRLKHDAGQAIEWSIDEQHKLEEGLAKFANEPNIMRYVKVAALLPEKTVRDVALRCKWMGRKRRKQEDQFFRKQVTDSKELFVESPLNKSISPASSVNAFSLTTDNHDQTDSMPSGGIRGAARHLLEENNQAFSQISANLSSLKLHRNINLFFRTKNNLIKILHDMGNMPGIMSQMPPLPVLLNEELANSIFRPLSQSIIFSSPSPRVASLKQELWC